MSIDPTRAATSIAALIRRALAQSGQAQASMLGRAAVPAKAGKPRQRQPGKTPDLAESITQRVAALDPADPGYAHRVLRVLVESALLHEFGDSLLNAPQFQGIVELVVGQMESSPAMAQDVATVISHLKSSAPSMPSPTTGR